MNPPEQDLPDPQLGAFLDQMRITEPRDPHIAARQRANFLREAREISQAVSPQSLSRLNKWRTVYSQFFLVLAKEQKLMFKTLIAFASLVVLFVAGGTVAAAQSSLPDEALYPLKLWTEDVRFSVTGDEQEQFQLASEFAARRMNEIQTMFQRNTLPPDSVVTRMDAQLQHAFSLVASLPEEVVKVDLAQLQTQLQQHEHTLAQIQVNTDPAFTQIRTQIQNMLAQHLRFAQAGAANPAWFRQQFQQSGPQGEVTPMNPWTTGTPTPGSGYGDGNGGNPWTTGTPTPGSGYGDGNGGNPWTTGTPTPGSGYGDGNGGNPWTTGTPTPGSGYGNGNGNGGNSDPTCTPTLESVNENGNGGAGGSTPSGNGNGDENGGGAGGGGNGNHP